MRRTSSALATAVLFCSLMVVSPLSASADDFTATNLAELREAVAAANASEGADTITLTADVTLDGDPGNDDPSSGDLDVTGDLTINADSGDGQVIFGGGVDGGDGIDRIFDVAAGTLTLNNLTLSGGAAQDDENGGGVRVQTGAALEMNGGAVVGSTAETDMTPIATAGSGGAIATAGSVTLTGTDFTDNSASRAGGAIEVSDGGSATIIDGDLQGNDAGTAPGNGGALHITGEASAEVIDSRVLDNTAVEGGGLWNSATGTLAVLGTAEDQSEITGNTASGDDADQGGGGIYSDGGSVTVETALVQDNRATGAAGSGGGILNVGGDLFVANSIVDANTAVRAGGGIEAAPLTDVQDSFTFTAVVASTLSNNVVTGPPGNGGAVHLTGAGDVVVEASTITGNTAVEGGGLWSSAVGSTTVFDTTLDGNTATGTEGGGALYNDGGGLFVFNGTISGNVAAAGGAVLSTGGDVGLAFATITDNASGIDGAAVIGNSIVTGNLGANTANGVTSVGGNVLADAVDFDEERRAGDDDVTGVEDPQVDELADNGGPTLTRLPVDGSPAIDAGVDFSAGSMGDEFFDSLLAADQRGFERPIGQFDSGAVEAGASAQNGDNGGDDDGDNGGDDDGGQSPAAEPVTAQPNYTG